ncbi:PD-(D/E)XK nuclease family protein, partial [Elusimicrobiota bacterium]
MNTSRFLRVVLAVSLPVASNASAGGMVVGSIGTMAGPSVGAGPIIQTGVAQPALGAGINTGAPVTSLGSTLPGMSAPRVSLGGQSAPAALTGSSLKIQGAGILTAPAALTPAAGLVKSRPAASVAKPATLNSALGLTSVISGGKDSAVAPQGGKAKSPAISATKLNALFDGSAARASTKDEAPVASIGKGTEQEEPLDMWFGRAVAKKMMGSKIYTNIGLIKGSGSEFYWNKFVRDVPVRVLVGGRMMYFTRIIKGTTKEIGKLRRKDFEGYYSSRIVNGKTNGKFNNTLPELRNRLLGEMRKKAYYSDNGPRAVTPHTRVRLVQFMSFKEARHLPENNNEPDMEARLRKPVSIPDALNGLHNLLPRMVFIDLDLLGDRIPFDLLEDMGKLQKAGVTFVFLSKKSQDEVDKIILRDLSLRQRDNVVRWKLFSLSNDGNTLYQYGGSFSQLIQSQNFSNPELDILNRAAEATRSGVVEASKGYGVTMRPKRGFLAEELIKELTANLSRFGLKDDQYSLNVDEAGRVVTIRPASLATAMPELIKGMQTEAGIYLNNEHIMTVTQNDSIMEQLPGSLHFTQKAQEVKDADMVETSLAAMLGPYRKNVLGDLAASASSLKSFKAGYMNNSGGFRYKIYMLLGHVLHTALDWAIMVYNDTGKLPSKEEVRVKAHEIWKHESNQQVANLLDHPGDSLAGYMEAMDRRLNDMHSLTADMLKAYPIALGTELSNLHVVERFGKDGQVDRRDIFRGLYDLVVAREVKGGLEVVVADFKTGQTPTIPLLSKDTQVLLYDFFSWATASPSIFWRTWANY